jgi:Trafficking protein particle complex subunit 10, TRAPPC10
MAGMEKLVAEAGVRGWGFRLREIVRNELVKRVDMERFTIDKEIVLPPRTEFQDAFLDCTKEDQTAIQNLSHKFFEVTPISSPLTSSSNDIPSQTTYYPQSPPKHSTSQPTSPALTSSPCNRQTNLQVVHTSNLSFPKETHLTVGKPVKATLSVSSTFAWNFSPSPRRSLDCYYDLSIDAETWAISGCKRAQFAVQVPLPPRAHVDVGWFGAQI